MQGQEQIRADLAQANAVSFGPYRLYPAARAFEKDGVPLVLGDRALDLLTTLVERAGQVVSHRELMTSVWRGLVVDPGNLRVHINSLRRTLGGREGRDRYIANVAGQGYSFVAPVVREAQAPPPARTAEYPCGTARKLLVLPPVLARLVGRDEAVKAVAADLIAERFVTLIGPGGIGKTTVAVCVAQSMLQEFCDAVCFIDLGTITDPELVTATVASKLGLTVQSDDVLPPLMLCLRSLRILLVLDNCEHVIAAAATLAERIFSEAPGVHILATSREAMRVEGERVFWLPPLQNPPAGVRVNAADALNYSAVRLFVERAAAGGSRLELTDVDVATVATICEGLDGNPLAIEFAAARVVTHGVAGTADLLRSHLSLRWHGKRTALPRHQTLHSLLDWSYGLLPDVEKLVLRRLAIFVGPFTIEAAQAVARGDGSTEEEVFAVIESLIAKSLLSISPAKGITRYRLLETTRLFAGEKLEQSGERADIALRHASYFASLLRRAPAADSQSVGEHLANIRAALEWAFKDGAAAHRALAIELAAGAVPVFLELSLLNECHRWSQAAIGVLDESTRGGELEMLLQESLAISATWSLGNQAGVRAANSRALQIARELCDTQRSLQLLAGRHVFLLLEAQLGEALKVARELEREAARARDPSYGAIAELLLGSSHHFLGDQRAARQHFEHGLSFAGPLKLPLFGLDPRLRALVTLNRVTWISGFPERALAITREAMQLAETSRPLNLCYVLLYSTPVYLWCGDDHSARAVLERLRTHPNWHALPSLHGTAAALHGALLIREGRTEEGIDLMRKTVAAMRADRQVLLLAAAIGTLAKGLVVAGRFDEAAAVIERAVAEAGPEAEGSHYPEILRVQAHILMSRPSPDEDRAEKILLRSLEEAGRQGALAWELRSSLTLARLRMRQGRAAEGREALSSVHGRFSEGFDTADLREARQLLQELG